MGKKFFAPGNGGGGGGGAPGAPCPSTTLNKCWIVLTFSWSKKPLFVMKFLVINRLVFSRFLNLRGNLGIVKEKPTRKTSFSRENFAWRCFFEDNGISIIISLEIDVKTEVSIFEKA